MTTERMTPDTLAGLRAGRAAILKIGLVASSWEERGLIDAMNELDATIAERDALREENERLRAVARSTFEAVMPRYGWGYDE